MTTATAKAPVKVQIQEIPKITRAFAKPAYTRVFRGGRGGGKTQAIAKRTALRIYQLAEVGVEGVYLSSREHLNSLDESSMAEIKQAIKSEPFLADYFELGEKYVRTKNRRISYAFTGLRTNLDSIKSKSRIVGNWTDEAENVSDAAWRKLIPTIRSEGPEGGGWYAENLITYNPESEHSATHQRFVATPDDHTIVTDINWRDNPWFPKILDIARLNDMKLRPDTYDHVWEGAFLTLTEAQIFRNKYRVDEFEVKEGWQGPYYGMDFGFAKDPTTAVECWINGNTLYIRRDCGKVELELDHTSKFFKDRLPGIERFVTRADSARPESISYLKRHGLARMESVKKWPGSVEDGIEFIKSFDEVVIHPDAEGTAREFRLYSYKVDRLSGDILPIVVDDHNHYIDAIRYALAPMMKRSGYNLKGIF